MTRYYAVHGIGTTQSTTKSNQFTLGSVRVPPKFWNQSV